MIQPYELSDKIVLLLAGTGICLVLTGGGMSVLPILAAIILGSALSYFEGDIILFPVVALLAVISFELPELLYFTALPVYEMMKRRRWILIPLLLLPLLGNRYDGGYQGVVAIAALGVLAIWLSNRTRSLLEAKQRYILLADGAREMEARLKAGNRSLLEQQDNEVNLATLKERNRIAREIHDHVGHQLSRAILQIGALMAVTRREEQLQESLGTVNQTLTEAMNNIRESVHDLHDQSVDLHMQIEELLSHFTFCPVTFDNQLATQPEKAVKLAFIAIVKEALSNIARHSDGTEARIVLREHPAFYQMIIRDNGRVGAQDKDTIRTGAATGGIGLQNMEDRVTALHGNMNIRTDNGFEIFISVPKEEC